MIRRTISTYFMLAVFFSVQGQGVISLTGAGKAHDIESWLARNQLRTFNESDGVVGDKYFIEEWKTGTVVTVDGQTSQDVFLKYDTSQDLLIFKLEDMMVPSVLKTENIDYFELRTDTGIIRFRSLKVNQGFGYYEELYTGQSLLYAKHKTKLVKGDQGDQAYGSGKAYDKYVKSKHFYGVVGNALGKRFRPTKSSILSLFGDHRDAVKRYIKERKLNLDAETSIVEIFKYYDNLILSK